MTPTSNQSAMGHQSAILNRSAIRIPQSAIEMRVVVERIRPSVDGGRFPIKRTPGESVAVTVVMFADGHDVIAAVLRDRPKATAEHAENAEPTFSANSASSAGDRGDWCETPMTLVAPGTDEWTAQFDVSAIGWHEYAIVAWVDRFLTWRRDIRVKAAAGQDVSVELLEGSLLVRDAANRAEDSDAAWLLEQADALTDSTRTADRLQVALSDELASMMAAYAERSRA